jgi:multidrug resistance protein, MATE family
MLKYPFCPALVHNSLSKTATLHLSTMQETHTENDNQYLEEHLEETTPLLQKTKSNAISYTDEIWVLCKTSIPVIFAYMLQNSLQTACVLIVGRMVRNLFLFYFLGSIFSICFLSDSTFLNDIQGAEELAASAFAFMFAMVTAWVMALGGSTALGE